MTALSPHERHSWKMSLHPPPSPAGELFAVNCCSNCWDQFERRELGLISLLLQCVQNQLNSPVISLLSTSPCNEDAQRSGNSRQRALGSLDSPAKLPCHIPDPITSTEDGGEGLWSLGCKRLPCTKLPGSGQRSSKGAVPPCCLHIPAATATVITNKDAPKAVGLDRRKWKTVK